MLSLENILKKILSKQHSESDLDSLIHLVKSNEANNTKEFVFVLGSNNNIQIGNSNTSTLQIDDSTYQRQELESVVHTLNTYLQEVRDNICKIGFENLTPDNFPTAAINHKKITYRHLTGLNEYPTLSLVEEEIPAKLRTILGIKKTPIIYTDTPVVENIRKFQRETGNFFLISYEHRYINGISYAINVYDQTHTDWFSYNQYQARKDENHQYNVDESPKKRIAQNTKDFEDDILSYTPEYSFEYSPVYCNLQCTAQDAPWTSIVKTTNYSDNCEQGVIFQFPKLSSVSSLNLSTLYLAHSETRSFNVYDCWIKKIIQRNPDVRGFLLFGIPYKTNISEDQDSFSLGHGCDPEAISCISPTPYVRFVDICNTFSQSIKIRSITFKISSKSNYELTQLDLEDRSREVNSGTLLTQNINISLSPQTNIIIPTEFGFDTKTYEKSLCYRSFETPNNILENEIYVFEMPSRESKFTNFMTSLRLKEKSIWSIPSEQRDLLLSNRIKLSNDFLSDTREFDELIELPPRRFAVGSFMDIISINVDGEEIEFDKPNDTPKFSMTMYFGYGSCPYLKVYSSKKRYWKELGSILYGRENQELQANEIFNLGDDTTKFRIEEREEEITFIQSLSIFYSDSQSSENKKEVIIPLLGLAEQKGEYFILRQGDWIEIDLLSLIPLNSSAIQLNVNGYYIIL